MNTHLRPLLPLASLLLVATLSACAGAPKTSAPDAQASTASLAAPARASGTVQSIREVKQQGRLSALLGTVVGAAVGGGVGANIGGGSGQIIASSVLSVITGNIGSSVSRLFGEKTAYEVVVRHDDGIDRTYTTDSVASLKPGVAVSVDGSGKLSAN